MNVKILARLEALIFTASEPISLKKLSNTLEISKGELQEHIYVLKNEYKKKSHGIKIKEYNQHYIFATKTEYSSLIEDFHTPAKKTTLSSAALETLAIIAYKQPVTRSDIEKIRGVKAEKTLITLSKYNLIQELGRKDTIGNPIVYGTTEKFLQEFDLENLSQLPEIDEIDTIDNEQLNQDKNGE